MTTDKKTDARKLDHATLEAMRLRAIEATKAGMKATDCDLIIFAGILMENICPPTTVLIQR